MRVYLAATFDDLRALHAERTLAAGREGMAVTPAFRESYAAGDDEELEYAALADAAALSLELVRAGGVEARRVVVACDVGDEWVRAGEIPGRVRVDVAVPVRDVGAVHVDDPDVDLSDAEGHELAWYATQEIPTLL
jgi:hypothetical protein